MICQKTMQECQTPSMCAPFQGCATVKEPTPEQVKALADAMWQLLDDMGVNGKSVCLAAKAQARIAYEPFMEEQWEDWMSLAEAQNIMIDIARTGG